MLAEEIIEPAGQHATPQVGRDRQRHLAADRLPPERKRILPGLQIGQRAARVLQVALALLREREAARGARQQPHA
jgi:hypothetical protein